MGRQYSEDKLLTINLLKMKNLIAICILCLTTSMAFAQESKKNLYVDKGDLIEATLFHANGQVAQTGFYTKANKLQGEWVSYDIEGNKTAVAQYENGTKVGTWYFYQDSNLKEVTYTDAKMAAVKSYKKTNTQVVSN